MKKSDLYGTISGLVVIVGGIVSGIFGVKANQEARKEMKEELKNEIEKDSTTSESEPTNEYVFNTVTEKFRPYYGTTDNNEPVIGFRK